MHGTLVKTPETRFQITQLYLLRAASDIGRIFQERLGDIFCLVEKFRGNLARQLVQIWPNMVEQSGSWPNQV